MFGKLLPPPYAGVEAHVDLLLRCLHPRVRGTLLACGDPAHAVSRAAEFPYRLLVERFYGRLASAPIAPGMLAAVTRELRSGRCNLLHLHAPNPLGDLAGLTVAEDVPVALSWHSDIVKQRALRQLYRPIQRRMIERADSIMVATPQHFETSSQLKIPGVEKKLTVVPPGFDFSTLDVSLADPAMQERIERFADGRPVLLTVGRHIYYKGYAHLIEAFARVKAEAVLVMIGVGPLTAALKQQAQELGTSSRIWFAGEASHSELVAAYHCCNVFTLPSIEPSEAFGMASAEAMACGKPTVVCELNNGVNFLNRAGSTSLAVAPRDAGALARALEMLLGDAALRQTMGAAASAWVHSQFSQGAMRDRTLSVYRSLM
jgi:glycosyltransferase involved in cell wall biosynthesis